MSGKKEEEEESATLYLLVSMIHTVHTVTVDN